MQESDSKAFAAFEYAGWERVAGKYDATWAGLTQLFIAPLLAAVHLEPGMRVLDVACGPGYVGEAAARAGATVTGLDFSPAMVELARARAPQLEFRVGDAQALPFADRAFDAVTMNFGLLHLPHPERALLEAARVLRPAGRYAFTVWAGPEESAGARLVDSAIQSHANLSVPLPQGPDRYAFDAPEAVRDMLSRSGFQPDSIHVSTVRVEWRIPSSDFLFETERDAGVRTAGLLAAQTPEVLQAIRRTLADSMRGYQASDGLAVPYAARVVVAAA